MVIVRRRDRFVLDGYFNGKRVRLSFLSKAEAEATKRKLMYESRNSVVRPKAAAKLSDSIRKYREIVTSRKCPQTQANEKGYFEEFYDFMIDEMCIEFLHEVELIHLNQFQAHLAKTNTAATVNRKFNSLKHFFNQCVNWDLIAKSPCERLKRLPENKNVRVTWSSDQIQEVVDKLPRWAGDVFFAIATTGMRPGEPCRLTWNDVNLERGLIYPKSFKGTGEARIRALPMPPNLIAFMQELKQAADQQRRGGPNDLVFLGTGHKPVTTQALGKVVRRVTRALGYVGLVPYGLRHTFITRLFERDEGVEKIRLLAGHASIKTTQNYSHVNESYLRETMARPTVSLERGLEFTGHKPVTGGNRKKNEVG